MKEKAVKTEEGARKTPWTKRESSFLKTAVFKVCPFYWSTIKVVCRNFIKNAEYAQVTKSLGGGWFAVNCFDGKQRRCHLRGSMKKRVSFNLCTCTLSDCRMQVWVNPGDIILVSLREYEDDKADIIHKYYTGEAAQLIRIGKIPDTGIPCSCLRYKNEFHTNS